MERLTHKDTDGTVWIILNQTGADVTEAKGLGAEKLYEYEESGLTAKEIVDDVRIHIDMWMEKINEVKKDRDFWKREAIKNATELGEIKIRAEVYKEETLKKILDREEKRIGGC